MVAVNPTASLLEFSTDEVVGNAAKILCRQAKSLL